MILWCPFSGSRACRNIHTFILFLFHSCVLSLCRSRIFLEVFFPAEHRILPYQAFMTVGRRNGARFVLFLSSIWFFSSSYFTVELGVVLFSNLLLCLLFDFPWPDVFHSCFANRQLVRQPWNYMPLNTAVAQKNTAPKSWFAFKW